MRERPNHSRTLEMNKGGISTNEDFGPISAYLESADGVLYHALAYPIGVLQSISMTKEV